MSKKTLVSAITAALVVGAASTTFAAANPFSDVPADSWAYDAVSTLAADGVIDGYPDGTYKGQNTMTRYEMAQIVARAMAKTDIEKADKALVDKLAAEFAEELDNLGVRVADLEKKSDNVKWGGELRYTYTNVKDDAGLPNVDNDGNELLFRLDPKAYIGNSGWTANARIDYTVDIDTDSNGNDATVDRIYVEGPLFGATVQAGKLPVFTAQGLVMDDPISGAQVAFGSDVFNTTIAAGRYNETHDDHGVTNGKDITAEYYGVQFDYTPNDKLAFNAGYTALNNIDVLSNYDLDIPVTGGADLGIWYVGGKYAFDKNVAFVGEYAKSDADDYDTAWTAELQYKGADIADAGSWGMYAGYRSIDALSVIHQTYDDIIDAGYKGAVVGVEYVPAENILATVEYFDGKNIVADDLNMDSDASKFFGRVDFFF